jgi:hypothetical protein
VAQSLAEATVEFSGNATIYLCKKGCGPILKVTPADQFKGKGGYRFGDWSIRNPQEVRVYAPNKAGAMVFAAPEVPGGLLGPGGVGPGV